MCRIKRIKGQKEPYIHLLEYDNWRGIIKTSECARKRIESMTEMLRPGKLEILMVTKVDKKWGFIDLSKKKVNTEDIKSCEKRFY